jgi:hypothetical protein
MVAVGCSLEHVLSPPSNVFSPNRSEFAGACQMWLESDWVDATHLTSGAVDTAYDLSIDAFGVRRNRHASQSDAAKRPILGSNGIAKTSGGGQCLTLPSVIAELFSGANPSFILAVETSEGVDAGNEFIPLQVSSAPSGLYTERPLAFRNGIIGRTSRGLEEWWDWLEDGTAEWSTSDQTSCPLPIPTAQDADTTCGPTVAQITASSAAGTWYRSKLLPTLGGATYRVSANIRWVSGSAPTVAYQTFDSVGSLLQSVWAVNSWSAPPSGTIVSTTEDWQYGKYADFAAAATATTAWLDFQSWPGITKAGSDDSRFDCFSMVPALRSIGELTISPKTARRMSLVVVDGTTRTIYTDGVSAGSSTVTASCDFSGGAATVLGGPSAGAVSSAALFTLQGGQTMEQLEALVRTYANWRNGLSGRGGVW